MADKLKEYRRGRIDGLLMALTIVRDGGIEALVKEIETRGKMGINTALCMKELDVASNTIKNVAVETIRIACVSILHDKFGFGQTRCQRFVNAFDKLAEYLDKGWIVWMDLIDQIKKDLKLDMPDTWLEKDGIGGAYAHPDPEDLYEEPDLISEEMWKAMLKSLKFSEKQIAKDRYQIFDNHDIPILQYEGIYNKIQVYDVLNGIQIARDHLGWKESSSEA